MHVTIDGFGGDPHLLGSEALVRTFLDTYPSAIGMTKIAEPQTVIYHGKKQEDWGVTGFVLIAESHIAIHTYPQRGIVWADVFSCKDFNAETTCATIIRLFDLKGISANIIDRGLGSLPDPAHEERKRTDDADLPSLYRPLTDQPGVYEKIVWGK